ncbi:MAG: hypothetical protein L3I99_05605 [Sulfurimonas sp.]|nr:hypothetical protein [Sulfurimonas sp.]
MFKNAEVRETVLRLKDTLATLIQIKTYIVSSMVLQAGAEVMVIQEIGKVGN